MTGRPRSSPPVLRSVTEAAAFLHARLHGTDLLVAGICGPAGAGKTSLCAALAEAAPFPLVRLDCDAFSRHGHADRQAHIAEAVASGEAARIREAEDPCNWYAFGAIGRALRDLRGTGHHTNPRTWNRRTGELDASYRIALPGARPAVVLCDGIYLLHAPVRAALDVALMVEAPAELRAARGQVRSKDDATRAALMQRLAETYEQPYFDRHGGTADAVLRLDPD